MKIVSITTLIPSRSGFAWWPCELLDVPPETPDDEAIRRAHEILVRDGLLRVVRFDLAPADGGRKSVRGRVPTVLGRGMIGTIAPLHVELVGAV